VIEEFKDKAAAIKATALDEVRTGAYTVDCTELKQVLVHTAMEVAEQLLNQAGSWSRVQGL
jgi:hypothetical protein